MIVLKWVFPVFLAVLAIVHLISCWRGDDDLRKPTKVALMPVVALTYLAFSCTPSLWVVAGLLFGCLGDLFLLWPLKKKVLCPRHVLVLPGSRVLPDFYLHALCHSRRLGLDRRDQRGLRRRCRVCVRQQPQKHSARAASAVAGIYAHALRAEREPHPAAADGVLVGASSWRFFGATFFLASDGALCDMLFVKKAEPTKQNFVVMLTYILAQTLLAVGFAACP